MLNFICAIPEEIGWVLVGAVSMIAVEMFFLVGKTLFEMVYSRLTDKDND